MMKKLVMVYFMSKKPYLIFDFFDFFQHGSLSSIQSFHSVPSQELEEEGDQKPKNLSLPPE